MVRLLYISFILKYGNQGNPHDTVQSTVLIISDTNSSLWQILALIYIYKIHFHWYFFNFSKPVPYKRSGSNNSTSQQKELRSTAERIRYQKHDPPGDQARSIIDACANVPGLREYAFFAAQIAFSFARRSGRWLQSGSSASGFPGRDRSEALVARVAAGRDSASRARCSLVS